MRTLTGPRPGSWFCRASARGLVRGHDALRATVDNARAAALGGSGPLRIGFQGVAGHGFMDVVREFEDRHPGCETRITELPLSDPFGPLHGAREYTRVRAFAEAVAEDLVRFGL
ncbi:hypothetical protein [Streptomyces griseolus]|uniref:hypothetical protein n=1 Tax=Streptomyces griseolus TaxID=1909 RepID=UPI0022443073|nr:hypothetical protein [Streptomyces griseolus]